MATPAQIKFDEQASAGMWTGSLLIMFLFGWPFALAFFAISLLLGAAASTAMHGHSPRR